MKKNFFQIAPAWLSLCEANGLDSFDAFWEAACTRVDEPNRARGGWSEVGVLTLSGQHQPQRFYLKRQENFNCRTAGHPLRGIPVALREWKTIQHLSQKGIATLDVVVCGRQCRSQDRAVLMTVALDDYLDMEQWLVCHAPGEPRKQGLLTLGRQIGRLHGAGMKHGCLYPKHVYFSQAEPLDLRFIDLEKCKRLTSRKTGLRDLDTLIRHTPSLTDNDQQQIYAGYLEACPYSWTPGALESAVAARVQAKKAVS